MKRLEKRLLWWVKREKAFQAAGKPLQTSHLKASLEGQDQWVGREVR